MKKQNLVIQHQQLENNKNFYYNIYMKSKEEIKQIALRIYQLEKFLQNPNKTEGKCVQTALTEIYKYIEGLSLREIVDLDIMLQTMLDKQHITT